MKNKIGVILPFIFLGGCAHAADKPVQIDRNVLTVEQARQDPEVLETKDVVVRTDLGSCECTCGK